MREFLQRDGISKVKKRQVQHMAMLNMILETSSRRPGFACLCLLVIAASIFPWANTAISADYGLVRYQAEPPASQPVPESTESSEIVSPSMDLKSGPIYSDGDIIYEGPEGLHPFDGPGMLSSDCGYGCPPSWTATFDAFYLNRGSDSQSSLSSAFRMPDFEYDTAGRSTMLFSSSKSITRAFKATNSARSGGDGT
jgi:hypothetical protein